MCEWLYINPNIHSKLTWIIINDGKINMWMIVKRMLKENKMQAKLKRHEMDKMWDAGV